MKTTLIITTYNWPQALALCLESVAAQTELPSSIVIADDGSTQETATVVSHYSRLIRVPVIHKWQPDKGYRRSAVLNLALREVSDDSYVIFIDGDVILHHKFIADHISMAEPHRYCVGRRAYLSGELSRRVLEQGNTIISPLLPGIKKRANALRLPCLSTSMSWLLTMLHRDKPFGIGCNLAVWMSDIRLVNGYDEDMEGWGAEDTDFIVRLMNAGVRSHILKFAAVMFHLHHEVRTPNAVNSELLESSQRQHRVRCVHGLDVGQ